jgi:cyanate permease
MLGYTGGFLGPLVVGWVLDLSGGMSTTGWGLAFLHIAVVVLIGRVAFAALRPRDLAGDRAAAGVKTARA